MSLLPDVDACMELPEFIEPLAPTLPAVVAAVLPALEPCACAPRPEPPGVPVVPIGVFCVLRWPAPTAGSAAGRGGVPWAMARLTVAAAAAAARILSEVIRDLLWWCLLDCGGRGRPHVPR